jgi:hypothetical protein
MSNSFAVTDLVAKEALRIAHEKATFIGSVDRQYDATFKMNGANPHGSTLRVKSPNSYKRRQGSRVMDVQDQNEAAQTITVATQDGVDMRFNSQELMQSVANDGAFDSLSKNYIEPAVSVLVSGIEADFLAYCTKATANLVGTAGAAIASLTVPGAARARLNQALAPKDRRACQMDSVTMASLVAGVAGYFAPSPDIGEQYREGLVKRTSMADFYENERVWTMLNSTDVSCTLNGAVTSATTGTTSTLVVASGATFSAGMVFTIAGVYDVHPETKQPYAYLKPFVVVSSSSATNIVCAPALRFATTDARQNCYIAAGSIASGAVEFFGALTTSYAQSLMYHPDAYQFVTGDLPMMDDAQKCVVKMKDNISIRVWMGSDIRNDELLMRLDILYGMAALRPEWGCRMFGAAGV